MIVTALFMLMSIGLLMVGSYNMGKAAAYRAMAVEYKRIQGEAEEITRQYQQIRSRYDDLTRAARAVTQDTLARRLRGDERTLQ